MRSKLLHQDGEATYAVIFETGDEVMAGLTAFAKEHGLDGGHFTAIGAFSSATLGFFDIERKEYKKIPIDEQVEVLTLIGDVTLEEGEPKIHAHAVLGLSDGTTRGGHLVSAYVRPTLELILIESLAHLRRRFDSEAGLALIQLFGETVLVSSAGRAENELPPACRRRQSWASGIPSWGRKRSAFRQRRIVPEPHRSGRGVPRA